MRSFRLIALALLLAASSLAAPVRAAQVCGYYPAIAADVEGLPYCGAVAESVIYLPLIQND